MNYDNKQLESVRVPQRLFESMLEAYRKWEKFSNEFEDFALSKDRLFIQKMKKAKREHRAGRVRGLEVLKQEL